MTAAALVFAGTAVAVFFGLLALGMRCDENCKRQRGQGAASWAGDDTAWQWIGQFGLISGALLCAAAMVAACWRRAYALAGGILLLVAALVAGWASMLHAARWGGF